MNVGRDNLSNPKPSLAAIEGGAPQLGRRREIIAAFQAKSRKKSLLDLEPWLEDA
jgi:hypothetical protein